MNTMHTHKVRHRLTKTMGQAWPDQMISSQTLPDHAMHTCTHPRVKHRLTKTRVKHGPTKRSRVRHSPTNAHMHTPTVRHRLTQTMGQAWPDQMISSQALPDQCRHAQACVEFDLESGIARPMHTCTGIVLLRQRVNVKLDEAMASKHTDQAHPAIASAIFQASLASRDLPYATFTPCWKFF